jgi:hypothetical protein
LTGAGQRHAAGVVEGDAGPLPGLEEGSLTVGVETGSAGLVGVDGSVGGEEVVFVSGSFWGSLEVG